MLRAGLSEDLGTLLYEIERTMLLDIELAVRPGTDPLGSRANLDAFHEVAAAYGMSAPRINAMIYAGSDGVSAEEGRPGCAPLPAVFGRRELRDGLPRMA